ncbi:MAG: hypothetical protein ABSA75_02505 [Candidatus Bathyarchaeia archaeon]|jgi:hypothetical protein
MGPRNILQPLLEQAALEQRSVDAPAEKTLLEIADKLVRWAPNLYSSYSNPSYSDEEKTAAKALLKKYGLEKLANLSPRYKKATLELIEKLQAQTEQQ